MNGKSEIIIIDTSCDSLSNELYEISIKKFLLFIINYHIFGRELTLISKNYSEFFNDNNDGMIEYNLVKGLTMSIKRFFLIIVFPHLDYKSLSEKFSSYRKNTR